MAAPTQSLCATCQNRAPLPTACAVLAVAAARARRGEVVYDCGSYQSMTGLQSLHEAPKPREPARG